MEMKGEVLTEHEEGSVHDSLLGAAHHVGGEERDADSVSDDEGEDARSQFELPY
jgi:hypothetical protein